MRTGRLDSGHARIRLVPLLVLSLVELTSSGGMSGCAAPVDPAWDELSGHAAALTEGRRTRDFPAVGRLRSRSGDRDCTATLVGRRTILTAAQCISEGSRFEFDLDDEGTFHAHRPEVLRSYPRRDTIRVDLGEGSTDLRVELDDFGILELVDTPRLSIPRASLSDEEPDDDDEQEVVGSEGRGIEVSVHDEAAAVTDDILWLDEREGGIARDEDMGGPTFATVGGGLFGGTERRLIVGIHIATFREDDRIPADLMADIRMDDNVSDLLRLADDDLCVDGRYEGRDDDVLCGGDDRLDDCGNGNVEGFEECDDGNTRDRDGCDRSCRIERSWECRGEPSRCEEDDGRVICGDGLLEGTEECDDDNTRDGDGCDARCNEEPGFVCRFEPSDCTEEAAPSVCGDGEVEGREGCDDRNQVSGDGCDSGCEVESGWRCLGEPSRCDDLGEVFTECGDGIMDRGEYCDDENRTPGDGCDGVCREEEGWSCAGEPSVCRREGSSSRDRSGGGCGNGFVDIDEECDDGNRENDDGCNMDCVKEAGWQCDGSEPTRCTLEGAGALGGKTDGARPGPDGSSAAATCAATPVARDEGAWPLALLVAAGSVAARRRGRRSS
jgi:cysteine-rich repeat protein